MRRPGGTSRTADKGRGDDRHVLRESAEPLSVKPTMPHGEPALKNWPTSKRASFSRHVVSAGGASAEMHHVGLIVDGCLPDRRVAFSRNVFVGKPAG